jgi:alpha-glucosidase (family GH31 glycosyl hydrolase)
MSGLAYHNSDIGGCSRMPTTPELYIRWMQYGAFCPIARAHGAGEAVHGAPTEPWQFGPEAETICRDYLRLRYRLLPYIYTMAHRNYESGLPLARPLFWLDPGDTTLLNESSSYMWGDAFLVSPVVSAGQRVQEVRLPGGTWINYWTGDVVKGGRTVSVAAPLERLPMFVKAGSIIPMAAPMNYSDEHPLDTLTLRIYPFDSGQTSYTLYDDDGRTREYQEGRYSSTTFTQHTSLSPNGRVLTLTVGHAIGEYTGKPAKRVYVLDVRGVHERPAALHCNNVPLTLRSKSEFHTMKGDGYYFDAAENALFASVLCQSDSSYTIEAVLQ